MIANDARARALETEYARGIDVSAYQGEIDWPRVHSAGISFVYVRATLGNSYDPRFAPNASGAAKAGLLVGGYHVFKPERPIGDQVKAFRLMVGDAQLPPALDCELRAECTPGDYIKRFCELVTAVEAEFGRKCVVYTYPYFWIECMRGQEALTIDLASRDLWIANYTVSSPHVPAPWHAWKLWQYQGNEGSVPGVRTACDRDKFRGTLEDLRAWADAT